MRLLGAVLLVAGCAGVGWRRTRALREQVTALEDMVAALDLLRGEILTNRTPLPEVAGELARSGPGSVRGVFAAVYAGLRCPGGRGFPELWRRSLAQCRALEGEAAGALERLGTKLGRFAAPEQAAAIDRCIARLERELAESREKLRRDGRLGPALGAAAGLVGSVLLF